MEFMKRSYSSAWAAPSSYPAIYLTDDNWDDFTFVTLFHVAIQLDATSERIEIGDVKILEKGQESGQTILPADRFKSLSSTYCSLGQDFSYYEILNRPEYADIRAQYFAAMRDIVYDPKIEEEFENERGFELSLVRHGGAGRAIRDARRLYAKLEVGIRLAFDFETSVGGERFKMHFTLGDSTDIPSRLFAVIGNNGCGKTQLLANLANVAYAREKRRGELDFQNKFGFFSRNPPTFSAVISISYSAFDTFRIPSSNQQKKSRTGSFGHHYCGLREAPATLESDPDQAETDSPLKSNSQRLKSIDALTEEFLEALTVARSSERNKRFRDAIALLANEPSLAQIGLEEWSDSNLEGANAAFSSLSTGHKIVMHIVTQLVAFLQPNALILIDEPESHLHPPLVATLLRTISRVLEDFESFGIIATHSPVVLQEIPKKYVRVLRRFESETRVNEPSIETFGEGIGALTNQVFDLENSNADYQSVLKSLAKTKTTEEIDRLFEFGLSAQAYSYVVNFKARGEV